jgi:hypothetical protein
MADKGSVAKGLLERVLFNLMARVKVWPQGWVGTYVEGGVLSSCGTITTVTTCAAVSSLNDYSMKLLQMETMNQFQSGPRSRIVKA